VITDSASGTGNVTPLSQTLMKHQSSTNTNILGGNQIEEIKLVSLGSHPNNENQTSKVNNKNLTGKLKLKEKSISSTGSSLQGGASIEEQKESPSKKKKKKGQDP
jgi:hypothetical protein